MAYGEFAYWYDWLNAAADYEKLGREILLTLKKNGVQNGIIADLGCGTGEITLQLANNGYDMLGIDASHDMLSVCREKIEETGSQGIMLLEQHLEDLDLYGTINAAISTFDTFNHLPEDALRKAIARVSLFTQADGLLILDANTPFKHEHILANNSFEIEDGEGNRCIWHNIWEAAHKKTQLSVSVLNENNKEVFSEVFYEYSYDLDFWRDLLADNAYDILEEKDGETFTALNLQSQRYFIVAKKNKPPS